MLGAVLGTDGPCTLHAPGGNEGLSAGAITITGTAQPITLEESPGNGYRPRVAHGDVPFVPGAQITAAAAGGADVPAFTALVTAPPELTGYSAPTFISRAGYTATWTANTGSEIWIMIGAFSLRVKGGALLMCRVADTGRFTVPASAFALLPPAYDRASVMVARVAETMQEAGDARIALEAIDAVAAGEVPLTTTAPVSGIRCETSPRKFFSLSLGIGGVSRNGDVPPTQGWTYRLQLGQRIHHNLHLVGEVSWSDAGYVSPYSTYTGENHWSLGAGVRWMPFEPAPRRGPSFVFPGPFVDVRAWYLTAMVGADLRDRFNQSDSTEDTAWSPMTSLAIGLLEIQGHDWSFGPEFREQVAYYDGHLQRGWMLLFAAHLNEW